ncbi:MAG TPA: hypothetical protein VMU73_03315, partial [Gaiellaceae bacterium]|nr:hypothetical protein [Gaiellaceae bacterium]
MAYDVDREPGAWVTEQAAKKTRSFAAFFSMLALALVVALAVWETGQHLLAVVAYVAFLCFVYAANAMVDVLAP